MTTTNRRKLLDSLLQAEGLTNRIPRRAAPGDAALSFAQQRLWFLDQLHPGGSVYNLPSAVRIEGALDVERLREALTRLCQRHEMLRTHFAMRGGEAVQVVAPDAVELRMVEQSDDPSSAFGTFSPLPRGEGHSRSSVPRPAQRGEGGRRPGEGRLLREEADRPFDLSKGPLFRALLVRIHENEHVLLLTLHHAVADGWSSAILWRELGALYEGKALPELPIQYADYAVWQREWLQDDVLREQLDYWRGALQGMPGLLELPTDSPRPAVQSFDGATRELALGPELSDALRRLGRAEGTTLFMTLLAAYQVLLTRYTGQEDFGIAVPIANRERDEVAGLIGFLTNTLVLRAQTGGEPSFRELLQRVRERALGAFSHQELPFEKLVEELQPERVLSHTPLCQVMFDFQKVAGDRSFGGLRVAPEEIPQRNVKCDLALAVRESERGITIQAGYSTALFDADMIERLLGHYARILEGIAADAGQAIWDIDLLTAAERREQAAWNDTTRTLEGMACLHELFERQAEKTPDAVALVLEGERLTYRELDERANRLAADLRARGVKPEVMVGICVDRSFEMIVGLLGILKAGGAYVPLDPSYPKERLDYMIADSGVGIVLTQDDIRGACGGTGAADASSIDNLAYTIYTSGSTGKPKGAMNTHRAVANRLLDFQARHPLTPADRVLQKTPYTFDVSVSEIFAPLIAGATLVIARPDGHRDGDYLAQLIAGERITIVHFVPSMLSVFLRTADLRRCATVRRVYCTGEASSPELIRELSRHFRAEVHNLYGPTEAAIEVTQWVAPNGPIDVVPIGKPFANTQMYVLDRNLRPVPARVPGELYIGGVQVGRGYHGRPELTAERFVPNPFGTEHARLYRTGDRARWLPDGNIEYLGRLDFQVKVRGFRIELGEIESVLLEHDAVRDAVVVARETTPGDKQLVGYVVPGAPVSAAALQEHLGGKLPEYMVPALFVFLDELPLTSSGKADRLALPAPEAPKRAFVAPETATERMIAAVWGDVLEAGEIGRFDHFFELGGHSLLAMQVIARIREASSVDVPTRALFEAPTVAQLAARIDRDRQAAAGVDRVPPLTRMVRDGAPPLSFAQQRMWFLQQLDPKSSHYNIRVCLRLRGPVDAAALDGALREIVRRHEVLRTTFAMQREQPVQIAGEVPERILVTATLDDESQLDALIADEARHPFDLGRGPLLRTILAHISEDEHALLLTMHHVVADGWSMQIFARELAALYGGDALPELAVQYADYALWQHGWLRGEVLDQQLAYWKAQLADVPALDLPTDRPRPAVLSHAGRRMKFSIPAKVVGPLHELGRREGVTLFMTLLTAFNVLLHRYTGQEDVAIGTPIAGRKARETEGLIGLFVNTLVMRSDLSGSPTVRELLARMRETALEAYGHQDVPFERLVDEIQPERDMSRSPIFQVMFSLQNTPEVDWALPGAQVKREAVATDTEKFDLSLILEETGDSLKGAIGYQTDLFDAPMIERLAQHFERVLVGMAANPDARVDELALIESPSPRLRGEGARRADEGRATIPSAFAEQANRTPDAIAVADDITYRDLNARANRLARHLRARGVGPDVPVGLCIERSAEMIVGLLGILKAGGAFVPLDPSYPAERVKAIVEDAGIRIVLGKDDIQNVAEEDGSDFDSGVDPDNLAYIIFTSGSTGRPKGVAITHRSVLNLEAALRGQIEAKRGRVAMNAPIVFDASVKQWIQLLSGATLVIVPEEVRQSGKRFLSFLEEQELDLVDCTPSHLQILIDQGLLQTPSIDATFLIGGEKIGPAMWRRLAEAEPARFYNVYGPTECTVDAALTAIREADECPVIGGPLWNAELYVLDKAMQPVPIGVCGELYIGGAGVGRGYINRPDLTAERFVPNPFGDGDRLYRTGDAVRWRENGKLEYLDRVDQQVKIRGFRIELGEIESVLTLHPDVMQAVVLVREDASGDKRLAAYVVPEPGCIIDVDALRVYLKAALPEYMVPAACLELDRLPLTINGKIDRRRLLAMELPVADAGIGYVAPRTPLEALLAEVMADVLRVSHVGVHDNFFQLGGHSLLAMQLVARIADVLDVDVPLRFVFTAPTVAELAELVLDGQINPAQLEKIAAVYARLQEVEDEEFEQLVQEEATHE